MQLQERILQLMKDSSDVLSLTYDEFCHIRNVLTRAELETLLFDEKLYNEVAQSKLCFTCRKVHFNILTFTFGIQCNVCKQKICRNCATQIAVPKERLNDLPIQSFTPLTLTKPLLNSDKCQSLDTQTPSTPTMNDLSDVSNFDDGEPRRYSTPANRGKQWETETIDICTDCLFLLQQIRKKSRHRHVSPALHSQFVSSSSSSFNRSHHSSSRSTSNYNLSTSSSASSIAAILAQQQQQRSLMVRATSMHANLKTTKSAQELSLNNDPLQTLATLAIATAPPPSTISPSQRVSLPRRHLFLQLQPTYDPKLNNIKTE